MCTKNVWLHHTMKLQRIPWRFWTSCLSNKVNFHQGYLSFTKYTIVQVWNFKSEIFFNLSNVFLIMRIILSNLSPEEPAQVSLPFLVLSLICGVFKCLNYLRFIFFIILRFDDRLIAVCSVIFLGAKCVWGRCSCDPTFLSNHSHKKQKDSLETWAVLIEISILCWNLPSNRKHRGSLQEKHGFLWKEWVICRWFLC